VPTQVSVCVGGGGIRVATHAGYTQAAAKVCADGNRLQRSYLKYFTSAEGALPALSHSPGTLPMWWSSVWGHRTMSSS
jgi:hypothetical protein